MKILHIIVLVLCTISTLYSQDSLSHYLTIAAKNNPTVLQKLNEYQAALQKIPQAGSLLDPEFTAGIFLSPMELVGGNQVAELQLMQMFPWFGVLKNAKDEMSLMARARFELFRDAKLQVYYDVQKTWYDLFKIQQDIRNSERNIEILRTLERLALIRFRAGSTGGTSISPSSKGGLQGNSATRRSSGSSGMNGMSENSGIQSNNSAGSTSSMTDNSMGSSAQGYGLADLYRIQIEIGELENNVALLKNEQSTIAAKFNSFLNRKVNSLVTIPDTIIPDTLAIPLVAINDSILANNPMLGMLEYEKQSLDARKKMVTRMGFPMVGIGANYSLINKNEMSASSMNGEDMIMPMVKVTLPIYRKKYKAMQLEANLSRSAIEQNYKATANALQTEYYEAFQLYQDAGRRMKLYESQSQLAHKSLDIMIRSFSVSGSGLSDILRVRQQTLDYELRQAQAMADYNTSIAWLKRLMAYSEIQ